MMSQHHPTATPTPSRNQQIQRRQLSVAMTPDQSNSVEPLSPFLKELKRHEDGRLQPPKERVNSP